MLDETKLFDFIKIMFTKPNDYKQLKDNQQQKN